MKTLPDCYRCHQPVTPRGECGCKDGICLIHGDCLDVMAAMEAESVTAIVTDPPAGISFMGKAWDHHKGGRDQWIEWMATVAAECLRVCKPGAHALVWAIPRTSHWTATAWEDAGWEVRDRIAYAFGSGFPKSLDVSKAIDKAAGQKRQSIGPRVYGDGHIQNHKGKGSDVVQPYSGGYSQCKDGGVYMETAPATPAAQLWQGYGTALKPCIETWWKLRKPLTAVPLMDILTWANDLMEVYLWQLSSAKFAERVSTLSRRDCETDGKSGSVRWLAAVWSMAAQHGSPDVTATFRSPEEARTFWSIALLWRAIWGESYTQRSTFTIGTETRLTTELRTLSCLLSGATPESIIQAAYRQNGLWCNALAAGESSSDCGASSKNTPILSAARSAIPAVFNLLVNVADGLSLTIGTRNGVIVPEGATTGQRVREEDWWLLRKPLIGTVAANCLEHGCGALNVDGCRVSCSDKTTFPVGVVSNTEKVFGRGDGMHGARPRGDDTHPSGRYPSHLIHDGSEEVVGLFPQQSPGSHQQKPTHSANAAFGGGRYDNTSCYGDSGSAARFFYCAKSSRAERGKGNAHPCVKPLDLMSYLCKLVSAPNHTGMLLDPFAGSGSTLLVASRWFERVVGIEQNEEYVKIAANRLRRPVPLTVLAKQMEVAKKRKGLLDQ